MYIVPVAARSKAWVWGRSPVGVVGSNPAGGKDVSVVCCQVEVSASGWSLVQRSPAQCDVSECDREELMRKPRPTEGCWAMKNCMYHISLPIRRTFFHEKCDLNSTCVLCAEGKYYVQTYKYPYIFYMKKVTYRVKTTMKMILVAVTTIFWVSMMNKLYYGC